MSVRISKERTQQENRAPVIIVLGLTCLLVGKPNSEN